jgi:hypothetical protein
MPPPERPRPGFPKAQDLKASGACQLTSGQEVAEDFLRIRSEGQLNDLGAGFPEWTELGQDTGLDPLGMQRPIEIIYQSLVPGISTITLRYRYYAFFPWILKYYEERIRHSDPAVFRIFQRRCEALFALICCRSNQELGVTGSDWGYAKLAEVSDQAPAVAVIDFREGADPNADVSKRYLRNPGGAFGAIYASQLTEMGLILVPDPAGANPIPICAERGLPLAVAFDQAVASEADLFFDTVESGAVSISALDALQALRPAKILPGSVEHRLLTETLLGRVAPPGPSDRTRRSTMLMLLTLAEACKRPPRADDAKWDWYEATEHDTGTGFGDVPGLWALYQACDLVRLAYEVILSAALTVLATSPQRRAALDDIVGELTGYLAPGDGMSWADFRQESAVDANDAQNFTRAMFEAMNSGNLEDQVKAALSLIMALIEKSADLEAVMLEALSAADHFQSLKTEMAFLRSLDDDDAGQVIARLIRERILKRHLFVASRKFRNQKAYTFLMEPDEGALRYRDHFRVSPSSPRLDQAVRFLRDISLIDEDGITALGRGEMVAA